MKTSHAGLGITRAEWDANLRYAELFFSTRLLRNELFKLPVLAELRLADRR